MILDKELEFSDGQAITATAVSTNVIDLGQTVDVAPGVPLKIRLQIDEAFDNLTSLNVAVQTDTVENFASETVLFSKDIVLADLVAGADFDLGILPEGCQQYLRLDYTVTGTNPSAGSVSAFIEVYQAPEGDITGIPGNL